MLSSLIVYLSRFMDSLTHPCVLLCVCVCVCVLGVSVSISEVETQHQEKHSLSCPEDNVVQGGLHLRRLNKQVQQVLLWAQDKFLSLRVIYIPVHLRADLLSRQAVTCGE